jgi:oxygen-dependent protoporphyrinogen oxidase
MRTAIIGGGIAGLAAAYELEQARQAGKKVEYTLFESRNRLGGSLSSEVVDGAVLERGPDSFLTEKPAAAELCRELGLGAELTPSNDADRKTCIVVRNRLVPLPDGLMFLIPTKLIPTALTRLFSLQTKIRMGLELLHPPRPSSQDESVASLVERHFGRETVDRLADPLLSGIFGGDSAQLSARTVLPRLVEMEEEYGSLTRGMLAAHRKMRARMKDAAKRIEAVNGDAQGNSRPAQRSIFTALRGGMNQLVDALAARLDPASVRLSTPVTGLEKTADGWKVVAGVTSEVYDAVILASPAWAAGELLGRIDPQLAEELRRHSLLLVDHHQSDLRRISTGPLAGRLRLPGSGGGRPLHAGLHLCPPQVPGAHAAGQGGAARISGRNEKRSPDGRAGRNSAGHRAPRTERDSRRTDFAAICPAGARPGLALATGNGSVRRRPSGAHEAHQHRVAALPGLKLAGNAYDGIGIPDCIRLGRKAAKELLAVSC